MGQGRGRGRRGKRPYRDSELILSSGVGVDTLYAGMSESGSAKNCDGRGSACPAILTENPRKTSNSGADQGPAAHWAHTGPANPTPTAPLADCQSAATRKGVPAPRMGAFFLL